MPSVWSALLHLARFTLQEALRERLIRTTLLMIGLGWVLAVYLDPLFLIETEMAQVAILGFLLRLGAVFQMAVLVTFAVSRDIQRRGIDMLLALPLPRSVLFLGKLGGFALAALLLALVSGLALLPFAPFGQVWLWCMTLAGELTLIAALSLLLAQSITHATLALTLTAGFYLLARSMETFLLLARQAAHADPHWTNVAAQQALAFIAGFLPSLQRFTVTDWLVYHTGSVRDLVTIGITTVIYLFLLTIIGLIDIHKKEF
ncbi:MAG: hypothetical protein H7833_11485 [Magnetococcus sp. DMHC-1]|nr:ABC transporter permease [Magnetococcales bacterium]